MDWLVILVTRNNNVFPAASFCHILAIIHVFLGKPAAGDTELPGAPFIFQVLDYIWLAQVYKLLIRFIRFICIVYKLLGGMDECVESLTATPGQSNPLVAHFSITSVVIYVLQEGHMFSLEGVWALGARNADGRHGEKE